MFLRMFGSLFLLALAIRAIGYPTVISKAGVHLPYAGDAYYHLRRICFSVARFPESLSFDRYVSFPTGSQIVWPPAFDWTIAALIRPFVDPSDHSAVEALAIWFPALLGAATAGVVGLLTQRFHGRGAGWCAGLVYCVLPMSINYSRIGMIDHHVAVALETTLALWLACEVFSREERHDSWASALVAPAVRLSAVLGLAMAVCILTWPGSLLHIGVLQAAFVVRWLLADEREVARSRAIELATSQAVLALFVAPFTLGNSWSVYGAWSPLVLSNFQPVYFASTAAICCLAQLVHDRSSLGASRTGRVVSALALALAGALVAFLLLRDEILFAAGWFTQGEELLGLINEMRPILAPKGSFDLEFSVLRFGAGFVVLPLLWLLLARRAFERRSAPQALLLWWSLAFYVLTLQQWRFGNSFSVVYALLVGAAAAPWISQLRLRIAARPLRPSIEILLVGSLVVWTGLAFYDFYQPMLQRNFSALRDEQLRNAGPLSPAKRIWDNAAFWIAENTPKTSGYLDAAVQPEYGVLSKWGTGHFLRYRSKRPMVQDNFGPYAGRDSFESAWAYFAETDEATAVATLERLGVRYLIGGPGGAGSTEGLERNAMAFRLNTAFGSRVELPDGSSVPGLSRHRLMFHAHTLPRGTKPRRMRPRNPFASLGVWEIVPGARIEGNAEPGAVVALRLELVTSSGVEHAYLRKTVADEQGNYAFVVPYSTDLRFSPDIRVLGDYELSSSAGAARLRVSEAEVLSGAVVRGPSL